MGAVAAAAAGIDTSVGVFPEWVTVVAQTLETLPPGQSD
jgi:hypothetical protein